MTRNDVKFGWNIIKSIRYKKIYMLNRFGMFVIWWSDISRYKIYFFCQHFYMVIFSWFHRNAMRFFLCYRVSKCWKYCEIFRVTFPDKYWNANVLLPCFFVIFSRWTKYSHVFLTSLFSQITRLSQHQKYVSGGNDAVWDERF
jgi:hypothetical protein